MADRRHQKKPKPRAKPYILLSSGVTANVTNTGEDAAAGIDAETAAHAPPATGAGVAVTVNCGNGGFGPEVGLTVGLGLGVGLGVGTGNGLTF